MNALRFLVLIACWLAGAGLLIVFRFEITLTSAGAIMLGAGFVSYVPGYLLWDHARKEFRALVHLHETTYGPIPDEFKPKAVRVGAAAGALTGHYALGAAIGAVVDIVGAAMKPAIPEEQRMLLERIRQFELLPPPFTGSFAVATGLIPVAILALA